MPQPIIPDAIAVSEHPAHRSALDRSRLARFQRGTRIGMPIFLGYMPVGAAFGVLAVTIGFSVPQAILCSATALAGAGQFIAVSLLSGGAGALMTITATAVVNLRYLLFGTTLSPHLRGVHPTVQSWLAFTLTDETFAVNIADRREGLSTPASMAGAGAIAWLGWVLGTAIGAVGAGWIGDPATWGLEFAMPAMFSALFVALAEDRRHVVVGLCAGVVALSLPLLGQFGVVISPNWFVVIAAIVTSTAAVTLRDE
jgi:4-azaleucine resistance transporter AzlC